MEVEALRARLFPTAMAVACLLDAVLLWACGDGRSSAAGAHTETDAVEDRGRSASSAVREGEGAHHLAPENGSNAQPEQEAQGGPRLLARFPVPDAENVWVRSP